MTDASGVPPNPEERQIAALDQAFSREAALIRLRSLTDFALSLWKGLTLVNGGAIVAMFTLLGLSTVEVNQGTVWYSFASFATGLAGAMFSNAIAYLCQTWYFRQDMSGAWNAGETMHGRPPRWQNDLDREYRLGSILEKVALFSAFVGIAGFIVGSGFALKAVLPNGVNSHGQRSAVTAHGRGAPNASSIRPPAATTFPKAQ